MASAALTLGKGVAGRDEDGRAVMQEKPMGDTAVASLPGQNLEEEKTKDEKPSRIAGSGVKKLAVWISGATMQ